MKRWPGLRTNPPTNQDESQHLPRRDLLNRVADLAPTAIGEDCVRAGIDGSGKTKCSPTKWPTRMLEHAGMGTDRAFSGLFRLNRATRVEGADVGRP
jgi:hypothetical protein